MLFKPNTVNGIPRSGGLANTLIPHLGLTSFIVYHADALGVCRVRKGAIVETL